MRSLAGLLAALVPLTIGVPIVAADSTPPVGTMRVDWDRDTQLLDVRFTFSDPESGIASIAVWCDSGPVATLPGSTTRVLIGYFDQAQGGCAGFGTHLLSAQATNGDGAALYRASYVTLEPWVRMETPLPAVTGQPFTIAPTFAPGYVVPGDAACRWEFRWGSKQALFDPHIADGTFGGLLFEGPASAGYCGPWTFSLPYVPLPRFHVTFALGERNGDNYAYGIFGHFGDDGRDVVTATVGTTDPRIRTSNLGLVQVVPDEHVHTVGRRTTYRAFAAGGAKVSAKGTWVAHPEGAQHVSEVIHQTGGTSFTFTPYRAGEWIVGWDGPGTPWLMSGYWDPPAKYPDRTRPTTTAPVVKFDHGIPTTTTIPVVLSWSGSDPGGWGIASYQLQRSIDGGPYKTILSGSKAKSKDSVIALYHSYRYRVRAIDNAGNVGTYRYGPTIRPYLRQETTTSILWTRGAWQAVADPDASAGGVRLSAVTTAAMSYRFTGRDVALIAPRGPDYGQARIYLDGKLVSTIDLNAGSDSDRGVVFRWHWSTVGTHRLRVQVVGTAAHPLVAVDAVMTIR